MESDSLGLLKSHSQANLVKSYGPHTHKRSMQILKNLNAQNLGGKKGKRKSSNSNQRYKSWGQFPSFNPVETSDQGSRQRTKDDVTSQNDASVKIVKTTNLLSVEDSAEGPEERSCAEETTSGQHLNIDVPQYDAKMSATYLDSIEKAYNHLMTNLHLEQLSRMHAQKLFNSNSVFPMYFKSQQLRNPTDHHKPRVRKVKKRQVPSLLGQKLSSIPTKQHQQPPLNQPLHNNMSVFLTQHHMYDHL